MIRKIYTSPQTFQKDTLIATISLPGDIPLTSTVKKYIERRYKLRLNTGDELDLVYTFDVTSLLCSMEDLNTFLHLYSFAKLLNPINLNVVRSARGVLEQMIKRLNEIEEVGKKRRK